MKRLIGLASLALWLWHGGAVANPVSLDFNFPGIQFDDPPDGTTSNITFRLAYDTNASDTNSDPNIGAYAGKLIFISDATSTPQLDVTVNVSNLGPGGPGTFDEFGIDFANFPSPPPPFPLVDGRLVDGAGFSLVSNAGAMLTSQALPSSLAFASNADRAFVALHRVDSEGPVSFPFEKDSFSVVDSPPVLVPEPSAYLIILAGFAGACVVRRMRSATLA